MNFIARALANIKRRLSKTILLVLTFFLIGNFVVIGLGINAAAKNAKVLTRKKMTAIAKLEVDYRAFYEEGEKIQDEAERDKFFQQSPRITAETIKEIMSDSRVKTINVDATTIAYPGTGTNYVPLDNDRESDREETIEIPEAERYVEPSIALKGNVVPGSIDFEKTHQIVEGRFYNEDEIASYKAVAVVSKNFADLNQLRVGSKFYLTSLPENSFEMKELIESSGEQIDPSLLNLEYEVVGIYSHEIVLDKTSSEYKYLPAFENPDNAVYIPAGSFEKAGLELNKKMLETRIAKLEKEGGSPEFIEIMKSELDRSFEETIYIGTATILLNDPLEVDNFVADHSQNLSGNYFTMQADNEDFIKFSKPLDTISVFANLIIWLVVINAVVIISLVTALTLKTREYEIGVLLSVGASKFKVVAQFFLELAIIASLGFTLAAASGAVISNAVGEKVLEYTVTKTDFNDQEDDFFRVESVFNTDYSTPITLDDVVSEYHVQISPFIILVLYIIGLSIVLVAVLIPSIMIMRFNPKRILMNQN